MPEIRRFLDALQPWEDWDMYIFDTGLQWCIAITHTQMGNRVLYIAAGDV